MLPLNFTLGLRGAGEPEGDAIKVEGRAKLGEGVRALGKKHALAVHIKFERETVFGKSGGQEIEIGQEIFRVVNRSPGTDPGTVIQQVEQGILALVAGKPPVRGGVQLPQRSGFKALPAACGGRRAWLGERMRQVVLHRPAPDRGRIQGHTQAAEYFRGGQAVRGRRLGHQQFA